MPSAARSRTQTCLPASPTQSSRADVPTQRHAHPGSLQYCHTPLPPPTPTDRDPRIHWMLCSACQLQACQPALSSGLGFSSRSLTPSTAISGNWCLTRLLLPINYLFPLFSPLRPSCQKGSCSPGRREAGSCRETQEQGGHGRPTQQPCLDHPEGAMSSQEARRDEGDTRRRGKETELRDRAHLGQQRRLKQATQFLHKDSADLLPLDSLKRLGTSKDLVRRPSPLPGQGSPWPFLSTSHILWRAFGRTRKCRPSSFRFPLLLRWGRKYGAN